MPCSPVAGGFLPGDAPTREMLVRGFFGSELGSLHEGPRVGEPAPDFTLKSRDGTKTIQLSKLVGDEAGGARARQLHLRAVPGDVSRGGRRSASAIKDEANFLMVYVREAHPTDGWKMESNTKAGCRRSSRRRYDERVAVCDAVLRALKPSMPVVVDEIDDPVGNAYSGMPARLYVIDTAGKIAYKSGRGPFGFKPAEMEQALVMALVESQLVESQVPPNKP